jgi:galactose mutarotase-like enzyme
MNKISLGTYKDVNAVILENDSLKVTLLAEIGSKIASIIYKPLNYEALWQNPGKRYKRTNYGDSYPAGEFSGFDEMFPSISRCFYENSPWAGVEIPDHGEVWSIPWQYSIEKDHVALEVKGVRLPYKLCKKVFLEDNRIRIEYQATNLSDNDMDFIWAAHPLFNTSKGMEFIVPAGMNKIVNAVPGKRLPDYGKTYDFPITQLADGSKFNLAVVPEKNDYGYQKYYFVGKVTEGWCIIYNPARKLNIGLSFPKEKVPYLGMWLNEGGWDGQYNIAPEPATAAMDSITAAKLWQASSVLKAGQKIDWHLNIDFKEVKKLTSI